MYLRSFEAAVYFLLLNLLFLDGALNGADGPGLNELLSHLLSVLSLGRALQDVLLRLLLGLRHVQ